MKDSRSTRRFPDPRAGRAALGAVLLVLFASCQRASPKVMGAIDGCHVVIESPRVEYRHPKPIPIRVTLRNGGTAPHRLTFPPARFEGVCFDGARLPRPREPVELFFTHQPFGDYLWRWPEASAPRELVLQPGESRVVIDTEFVPPRNGPPLLHGGLCVRVYGWEIGTGVGYAGPRR